ncbi:unnamed protein product [Closterium sp. NIES-64]|nr:unnamed protein product [Closterium sp. NIES-64]
MQRPRERHAQCAALALAWWLAALATPAVVHAQVMAASQVTFLRDCQAAWGQVLAGWTSFNGRPITCQAATGIDCDTSGMITQIKFQGGIRGGRLPSSISNLRELTVLYLRYKIFQ